ncbi:MAG TPA: DUF4124 domain-containing protein, partial [Xanthomonadaceae bacterium]|nr:DUF4124 domain-containing protein [Xanthomonadaceae bacterium]
MRNQSIAAPFLAKSSILMLMVAIGLLASAGTMAADPVYKWVDAKGQSHYSQSPPQGQKYETITPSGDSTTSPSPPGTYTSQTTAAAPAKPTAPHPNLAMRLKNCETARSNVAALTNNPTAPIDTSGAGKP